MFSKPSSSCAAQTRRSPRPDGAHPGSLEYHIWLRREQRAYERMFMRDKYAEWVAKGCPPNDPNPPDIWLAELAATINRDKIPDHLLDLDRMQVILQMVKEHRL